ncbi:hypothetical protein M0804_004466 [Polistes exclamans]|nr:hypothetical protein M0804_004466 [Polistes exclamans]
MDTLLFLSGLQPASTKAQPTSIGKSHRPSSGVLPQGHTPGPGPGGQQNNRSFAAALRNLAKQAGPAPQEEEPRASPKNRAPPPLVRGPSPAKERTSHERRPEEVPSLYTTTARPTETSKHSVTATTSELLARSGFQPYRPEHHPAHAPPAFALDPAAYNPYHHGLYPPPHLQHAYRLEEQLYLERCGMLRPPLFPGLPSLKLEEEHRLRQAREQQAAIREEEERRRAARNTASTAPVPAPTPASTDTAARKPTIAAQMHSERERERESSRDRQNSNSANSNNASNNNGIVSGSSSHHQSRKDESSSTIQATAPQAQPQPPPPPPPVSDPSAVAAAAAAAAAASIYHSRLPPFPSPAAPIGPSSLGSASICSVSSAPIPPPLGSTLTPLNLGPPPPAISTAPIGPPPIPSIPPISSLTAGVIGPPPPLSMPLAPIISIPSLHLPPVPSSTIHSSQHTATIMSSATTTVTSSIYYQQQHQQQAQQSVQHQQRSSNTNCTTTINSLSNNNTMTTHATHTLPTPGAAPSSLNSMNHVSLTRKSPPLLHSVHIPRNKEVASTTNTTTSTPSITTTTTSITTTTVPSTNTTTTSSSTTIQPAFVRPFEDSFRSSVKPQQRPTINCHNHSIANQINHQEPTLKSAATSTTPAPVVGQLKVQENSSLDNGKPANIQSSLSQPISYSPQFHHPHIPVPHLSSIYKPPHFSTPTHQHQHHSSNKMSIQSLSGNSGNITNNNVNIVNNMNNSKQQNSYSIGEYQQTTQLLPPRNESAPLSLVNCTSNDKVQIQMSNNYGNGNCVASNTPKISNHTNTHHKRLPILPFHPAEFNQNEKQEYSRPDVEQQKAQNDPNIMSTLPFQPSFKFSISEIAQKPIDTSHLMQSIKSEEVLRTCQNVSNVLLQIPKYQEKLLNFSNNELKTAFCFTDKCNNLTEISVKCEPAVLNVPDVSKALAKQEPATNNEQSFAIPEKPKELTSSLDLAEKRRKRKRDRNAGITCSSDSEGEEDNKEMDLWIIKGPPAKLQYSCKKLSFLAMFGLTTLSTRNEIELCKVEKRYKLNPDPPEPPLETEATIESVLPIPREHPDVLLQSPDFEPKVGFLRTIGLNVMPPHKRDEAEATWQYVLQDRKKRKSTNSVTVYCERIAKVYSKDPPPLPKPPQKMRLLDRVKVKHVPERPPPLPPLPNIIHLYTKTRSFILFLDKVLERRILTSETSRLAAQSNALRSETVQLERRIYELLSTRTALDSEKRVLSEKIERMNALVRTLR